MTKDIQGAPSKGTQGLRGFQAHTHTRTHTHKRPALPFVPWQPTLTVLWPGISEVPTGKQGCPSHRTRGQRLKSQLLNFSSMAARPRAVTMYLCTCVCACMRMCAIVCVFVCAGECMYVYVCLCFVPAPLLCCLSIAVSSQYKLLELDRKSTYA